jgi:hypothetical protein
VAVVLFAQAAAAARVSFFGWRPPYAGWLLMVVILVGGAMLALGPLTGGIIGAALAVSGMWIAVMTSRPVAFD